MTLTKWVWLLAVLIAASGGAGARSPLAQIDDIVREAAAQSRGAATVALVVVDGQVRYRRAFGAANLDWNIPATPDTVFGIGSVSKSLTARAILGLVAANRLRLNEPLSAVLSEYSGPAKEVTIAQLLGHTSGIPNYTESPSLIEDGLGFSRTQVLALFQPAPLLFRPGSEWSYTNSGYFLLGLVAERVTGEPFAQVLEDYVTGGLEMTHTALFDREAIQQGRADGYEVSEGRVVHASPIDATVPFAAGAVRSTVDDLARFIQPICQPGPQVSQQEDSLAKLILQPIRLSNGDATGYTAGGLWDTQIEGHRRIHHSGSYPGFEAHLACLPERRATIVVLRNIANVGPHAELTGTRIARVLLGLSDPPASPQTLPLETAKVWAGTYYFFDRGQPLREASLSIDADSVQLDTRTVDGRSVTKLDFVGNQSFVSAQNGLLRVTILGNGAQLAITKAERRATGFRANQSVSR